jgi:hypothetical protein
MTHEYTDAELQRRLAEDSAISELGIDVVVQEGGVIVLSGQVESVERLDLIAARAGEHFAPYQVVNQIVVVATDPPTEAEEVS